MDYWYCETVPSNGVTRVDGVQVKGAINAVQDKTSPYWATSVFNPAFQFYAYISFSWKYNFDAANMGITGCSVYQKWYLSLAYWLTGDHTTGCTPDSSDGGLQYVQSAEMNYQQLFGKPWPYPGP